jgi:hypothetical protein
VRELRRPVDARVHDVIREFALFGIQVRNVTDALGDLVIGARGTVH